MLLGPQIWIERLEEVERGREEGGKRKDFFLKERKGMANIYCGLVFKKLHS